MPLARALQPLSPQMLAELEQKHMPMDSPILIRLFKEESEIEVWKQDTSGRFALLKTYPICRWSGELGPKTREGDRQAPEGFYTVRPGQMNPNSHHYLSFDIGYPNAYDRAYGRNGGDIMMHGGCSSAGCYAITDEQIAEIYALARESFYGNQRSFQIQAYPFRMTPPNLVNHSDNPNMPFWRLPLPRSQREHSHSIRSDGARLTKFRRRLRLSLLRRIDAMSARWPNSSTAAHRLCRSRPGGMVACTRCSEPGHWHRMASTLIETDFWCHAGIGKGGCLPKLQVHTGSPC